MMTQWTCCWHRKLYFGMSGVFSDVTAQVTVGIVVRPPQPDHSAISLGKIARWPVTTQHPWCTMTKVACTLTTSKEVLDVTSNSRDDWSRTVCCIYTDTPQQRDRVELVTKSPGVWVLAPILGTQYSLLYIEPSTRQFQPVYSSCRSCYLKPVLSSCRFVAAQSRYFRAGVRVLNFLTPESRVAQKMTPHPVLWWQ